MKRERVLHCLAVAEKMKAMCLDLNPRDFEMANEMFTLGLLHDIGYELSDNPVGHSRRGGEFLERQGYKFSMEVYFHGSVSEVYSSFALDLLNKADMSINSKGEDVGTEKRLAEILNRYGKDSYQYLNARTIIDRINKREVYHEKKGKE